MKTAHEILQAAQKHMKDRASTYDKPEGERSMKGTVDAFKAITGVTLTEEQGWLFMAVLKAVRSQQGGYSSDSYEDGAAYFALAGEAAYVDRTSSKGRRDENLGAINKGKNPDTEWKKWYGGDWTGPVGYHEDTMVNVIFRGGEKSGDLTDVAMIKNLYWGVDGKDSDIIAYRIVR